MHKSIVYCPGVWDMLHIGHINFLRRAKALGDVLVVGVQSDEFVSKQKGQLPIVSTKDRIAALESLKCVDIALAYHDYDYISQFNRIGGDIFVLSEEYYGAERFKELSMYLKEDCKKIAYLPYDKSISTTSIRNKLNEWSDIWEKVALCDKDDYDIVGHDLRITSALSVYFTRKLGIEPHHTLLDYGCGSGTILSTLNCYKYGIDISKTMIARALLRCPDAVYLVSDEIPLCGSFDHIISWGVLHYLPNIKSVELILDKMLSLSESIMLLEIPDITMREQRLEHRKSIGKILTPEPLYFSKELFTNKGFKVLDNEPKLTDNSKYSFSVIYEKV